MHSILLEVVVTLNASPDMFCLARTGSGQSVFPESIGCCRHWAEQ